MPGNTMFRWTASSLVAVFTRARDAEKVRKEVADLNKSPLVHKIVLSGRTAGAHHIAFAHGCGGQWQ
jgi:hypothetical protein